MNSSLNGTVNIEWCLPNFCDCNSYSYPQKLRFVNAKFTDGVLDGNDILIYIHSTTPAFRRHYHDQQKKTYLIGNFRDNILESGTIYHESDNETRFKFVFNSLLVPPIFEIMDKQVGMEKYMATAFLYFRTFIFGICNNNYSNNNSNNSSSSNVDHCNRSSTSQCSLFSSNGIIMTGKFLCEHFHRTQQYRTNLETKQSYDKFCLCIHDLLQSFSKLRLFDGNITSKYNLSQIKTSVCVKKTVETDTTDIETSTEEEDIKTEKEKEKDKDKDKKEIPDCKQCPISYDITVTKKDIIDKNKRRYNDKQLTKVNLCANDTFYNISSNIQCSRLSSADGGDDDCQCNICTIMKMDVAGIKGVSAKDNSYYGRNRCNTNIGKINEKLCKDYEHTSINLSVKISRYHDQLCDGYNSDPQNGYKNHSLKNSNNENCWKKKFGALPNKFDNFLEFIDEKLKDKLININIGDDKKYIKHKIGYCLCCGMNKIIDEKKKKNSKLKKSPKKAVSLEAKQKDNKSKRKFGSGVARPQSANKGKYEQRENKIKADGDSDSDSDDGEDGNADKHTSLLWKDDNQDSSFIVYYKGGCKLPESAVFEEDCLSTLSNNGIIYVKVSDILQHAKLSNICRKCLNKIDRNSNSNSKKDVIEIFSGIFKESYIGLSNAVIDTTFSEIDDIIVAAKYKQLIDCGCMLSYIYDARVYTEILYQISRRLSNSKYAKQISDKNVKFKHMTRMYNHIIQFISTVDKLNIARYKSSNIQIYSWQREREQWTQQAFEKRIAEVAFSYPNRNDMINLMISASKIKARGKLKNPKNFALQYDYNTQDKNLKDQLEYTENMRENMQYFKYICLIQSNELIERVFIHAMSNTNSYSLRGLDWISSYDNQHWNILHYGAYFGNIGYIEYGCKYAKKIITKRKSLIKKYQNSRNKRIKEEIVQEMPHLLLAKDIYGNLALHIASEYGYNDVIGLLLKFDNCDLNGSKKNECKEQLKMVNYENWNALAIAIIYNQVKSFEILLNVYVQIGNLRRKNCLGLDCVEHTQHFNGFTILTLAAES